MLTNKKEEVQFRVQNLFRDVFDDEKLVIQNSTNSGDIDAWDSLNHISIVHAIEKEFNIKFNFDELAEFADVGNIIEAILKKI